MKRVYILLVLSLLTKWAVFAQNSYQIASQNGTVCLTNSSTLDRKDYPVVVSIKDYPDVQQVKVTLDGKEIPSQLDDLDRDGFYDELCFLVDIKKGEKQEYKIEMMEYGEPRQYNPRTFAEIMLRNPKIKEKNKHDLYLSEITATQDLKDQYHLLHHHGVAFESELIAIRIYFDKRQTLDLYGKKNKGLEVKETQFYPTKEQKAAGFGDDVLWVGNTFGLGALRGWDGNEPTMIEDVMHRTQRIIATGPVRTIVELEDRGWKINENMPRVNTTIRYTLYGGHRDIDVDVFFNRDVSAQLFSTGIINVKGSEEFTDHKGVRGCWGTAFPSSEKDSVDHPRETVGLGIYVPDRYRMKEVDANKDNYAYVLNTQDQHISYKLVYTSANETFGPGSKEKWFGYLKGWRKEIETPVEVSVNMGR